MNKHKKGKIKERSETVVSWVKEEIPKKGQHGKKANITRGIEKESYPKIQHHKKEE